MKLMRAVKILKDRYDRKVYNRTVLYALVKKIDEYCKSKNVTFIYAEPPRPSKIKNLSKFEKYRLKNWTFDFNYIERDLDKVQKVYGPNVDLDYLRQVYDGAIVVDQGGYKAVLDFTSKYVNIVNGIRITVGQPNQYINKIHMYGACTVRGTGVEDSQTIASYLQNSLNEKYKNGYQVYNHGIGCGSTIHDDWYAIQKTSLQAGDVVILCSNIDLGFEKYCRDNGITFVECSSVFDRPHTYGEWFTDRTEHTNAIGNQNIAIHLSKFILKPEAKNDDLQARGTQEIVSVYENNQDLKNYIAEISKHKVENAENLTIGSIVMNCNPFTNGHKFLIETAARMVDRLYIFVVEENKSFFQFEDRLELVKKGTAHLENVCVLPSGKFIISAETFPGYFYKADLQGATIDASKDVDTFGQHIAPALGITYRFAGEEPLDLVTRQYNQAMEERLPLYGIKFIVIPRKKDSGEVISASRVRAYMKEGKWDEISKIVPETTYNFLLQKYGGKVE